jgi:hypothetical protein
MGTSNLPKTTLAKLSGGHLYTVDEFARAIKRDRQYVYRMLCENAITGYRVGQRVIIVDDPQDTIEWLKENGLWWKRGPYSKRPLGMSKEEYHKRYREKNRKRLQEYQHSYYTRVTKPKRKAKRKRG